MKDKARITGMICNAADGFRLPVAIIGKAKSQSALVCYTQRNQFLSLTNTKRAHSLIRTSQFGG